MTAPQEIVDRYKAGEREIRVSPDTYREYCDGLMTLYRRDVRAQRSDTPVREEWVWYKAARVVREEWQ